MAVWLDNPLWIGRGSTSSVVVPLKSYGVPEDATIVFIQTVAGQFTDYGFLTDYWNPTIWGYIDSNDVANAPRVSYYSKLAAVSLGPVSENKQQRILRYMRDGYAKFYLMGYLMAGEATPFPEIMDSGRETNPFWRIPKDGETYGWGADTYAQKSLWDIPILQSNAILEDTSAVIIENGYDEKDNITAFPYKASLTNPRDMYPYKLYEGCINYGLFNEDGLSWAWGNKTLGGATIVAAIHTPAVWYTENDTVPRSLWNIPASQLDTQEYVEPDPEADYLYMVTNTVYAEGVMYREGQEGSILEDNAASIITQDTHLVDLGDGGKMLFHSTYPITSRLDGDDTYPVGYFKKVKTKVCPSLPFPNPMVLTAPALYYPPDNLGSQHLNYAIETTPPTFSDVSALVFNLSGGIGNTDADSSIGGVKSTAQLSTSLFDDIAKAEVYLQIANYRCLYLTNTSVSEAAYGIRVWVSSDGGACEWSIGMDAAGVDGTPELLGDETEVPDVQGLVLSNSQGSCYTIPVLGVGETIPLWVLRTPILDSVSGLQQAELTLAVW